MSLTQTEYLQLVYNEAIVPKKDDVFECIESDLLINYWNSNQSLPKSIIEPVLLEDIGFCQISDDTKSKLINRFKYHKITMSAYEEKDADLSCIVTSQKLEPLSTQIEYLINNTEKYIPCGISELDIALNGGVLEGAYGLVLAETNIGKTTILLNLALNFMKQNKKVIYITFEESIGAIFSRLAQNILRLKRTDVPKINTYQQSMLKPLMDNIIVIAKSPGELSVDDFLQIISEESYDALFIDYYPHFKKSPKLDINTELTNISSKLMGHANLTKKIIWSAAQLRREAFGKIPTLADAATSIDSVRQAQLVLGVTKGETFCDEIENKYHIKINILKERQGANRTETINLMLNVHFQQIEQSEQKESIVIKTEQQTKKKTYIIDAPEKQDPTKIATLDMFKKRII